MPARVAVITDSTSYLPAEAVRTHGLTVVPLQVAVGDRTGDEGVVLDADGVARTLAERGAVVRTSRPTPERFRSAYDAAVAAGCDGVVVVTLSSKLSGTYESARAAAEGLSVPVRVVDSGSTAMGLGFAVLAAARRAVVGDDVHAVASAA